MAKTERLPGAKSDGVLVHSGSQPKGVAKGQPHGLNWGVGDRSHGRTEGGRGDSAL